MALKDDIGNGSGIMMFILDSETSWTLNTDQNTVVTALASEDNAIQLGRMFGAAFNLHKNDDKRRLYKKIKEYVFVEVGGGLYYGGKIYINLTMSLSAAQGLLRQGNMADILSDGNTTEITDGTASNLAFLQALLGIE